MARYVSYRDFDWILLGFVLVICGMGVMEIHSATMHTKFAGAHVRAGVLGAWRAWARCFWSA